MGRHSSPNQAPFYRSLFSWVSLWAVLAFVTGVAVWLFVGTIAGDETQPVVATQQEPAERDPENAPEPAPSVSGLRVGRPDPAETGSTKETSEPEEPAENGKKLVTDGVTVQVLNGTLKPAAAQALADELGGLGYSIVAVEESSRVYSDTTVFWSSPDSKDEAMALAERFGWLAELKPGNLSDQVSFHVVVGADET